MTADYIRNARADAWWRAHSAALRGGKEYPPACYYDEPYPNCPPDDELDDDYEYDEDGTEYNVAEEINKRLTN